MSILHDIETAIEPYLTVSAPIDDIDIDAPYNLFFRKDDADFEYSDPVLLGETLQIDVRGLGRLQLSLKLTLALEDASLCAIPNGETVFVTGEVCVPTARKAVWEVISWTMPHRVAMRTTPHYF
ncbi:hypothetical protein [Rhodoblastus sp.]|jgi:acyl-CoA thioesterase FadM|uniref:hypothetical protein n=1 Tax=Rhodoblastus sp. TaxID=1962975 RepID=UPI0025E0BFF6|nr:hypothetical protein [Rhodoblastus sp.]